MKLTAQTIAKLESQMPAGKIDFVFFDDDVQGFGIRLRKGSKAISYTFIFQYSWHGNDRRMRVGKYPALSPQAARDIARGWYGAACQKRDIAREMQAAQIDHDSFGQTVALYLADKKADIEKGDYSERTYVEAARYLNEYAKRLHSRPLANISRADIADLLDKVEAESGKATGGGPTANRLRSNLSSLFIWAQRKGKAENNPVAFTEKREEKARDRVLTDDELRAIWNVAGEGDYGRIVKLLMLTGQRREEIGGLHRDEIAGGQINLPPNRTKNGKAHFVPLSEAALDLLPKRSGFLFGRGDGSGGFAGWSAAKAALDKRLKEILPGMPKWRLHDLRHTVSTRMHDSPKDGGLGVFPHIVEAVINHISGHKAGDAGRYNHANYSAERKAALDMWSAHVLSLVTKRPFVVVAKAA
jgi:integrase